jgi:hypothetical protein
MTEDTDRTTSSPRPVASGNWRNSAALTLTVYVFADFVAGLIGCVLLDDWFCHLLLFNGTSHSSWIGLLVVMQNIVSSLLISYLFDIHQEWLNVLGVCVVGGAALKMRVGRSQRHVGKIR